MSSAATQAAPYQSSTITSLSPSPSSTRVQHVSHQTGPRDPYYERPSSNSNASPSASSRRASRKSSNNGATPQQTTYNSSVVSSPSMNAPIYSSPMASQAATIPSGYSITAHSDTTRSQPQPPSAPPRSSSNAQRSSAAAAAISTERVRRPGGSRESESTREAAADGLDSPRGSSSRRTNGDRETTMEHADATAVASTRARRKQEVKPESLPVRSKESGPASRSNAQEGAYDTSQKSGTVTREPSEVLNRVVVSNPQEDLVRERERLAEAVPYGSSTPTTSTLNVVGSEGIDDNGRGGSRTRQDHSNSGRKEKNGRLGEYLLGNTLGEGEFGKVKLGWKQEGGVQVRRNQMRAMIEC